MALRLKNKQQLSRFIKDQAFRIEKALIFQLEYLVAELQNHAKDNAGYTDQTANLKSSIGGVVLKDGKPVTYRGFVGTEDGTRSGLEFINSLIDEFQSGYAILIVAGMEYATYVEDIHNLNVLKKTELELERELPKLIRRLKLVIK
jgi:hypothetical protein